MRRFKLLALVAALGLFVAACGDDDDTTTDSGDDTEQVDDAGDEVTNDDDMSEDMDEAAEGGDASSYAGSYTGGWENTTFGSTGDATAEVTVDGASVTIVLDLGGFVFGGDDPGPQTLEGSIEGGTATFAGTTDLFGDYTLEITEDGAVTFDAPAIPAAGIASMAAAGTLTDGSLELTYTVAFDGGGDAAEGTMSLTQG